MRVGWGLGGVGLWCYKTIESPEGIFDITNINTCIRLMS